jgi:hypothetical protein
MLRKEVTEYIDIERHRKFWNRTRANIYEVVAGTIIASNRTSRLKRDATLRFRCAKYRKREEKCS